MAAAAFFRTLSERFTTLRESHDKWGALRATYERQPLKYRALEFGEAARSMAAGGGDPDSVYVWARAAARAALAVERGDVDWHEYSLSIESHSGWSMTDLERESLTQQWSALAAMGGAAIQPCADAFLAREAWLNLLRSRSPYFRPMQGSAHVHDEHFSTDSGTIEQLCRASAEICVVLESQAIVGVGIESDAAVKVLLTAPAAVADPSPSSNQQRVDAFLRQASRKHGERLPENYIWKTLCNYKDDTRFRQWKQGKLNPRARAARAFEKVVSRAADLLKD